MDIFKSTMKLNNEIRIFNQLRPCMDCKLQLINYLATEYRNDFFFENFPNFMRKFPVRVLTNLVFRVDSEVG